MGSNLKHRSVVSLSLYLSLIRHIVRWRFQNVTAKKPAPKVIV